MEGDPRQKCLVDGCDWRMRRDGLCLKHLAALVRAPADPDLVRAVKAYHARRTVPAARTPEPAQDRTPLLLVRDMPEILAALGISVVDSKVDEAGDLVVTVANGLRVILDDDDIEQFMALAAIADPVLFGDGQIASAKDQQRVDRLLRGEATK